MPRLQGVGPRIAARLKAMGYVRADGRPDVPRFAWDFHYDKTVLYEWLADRRTPTKDLDRLCADLQVSRGYLLFGEGEAEPYTKLTPIRGGSAAAQPRPVVPSCAPDNVEPKELPGQSEGSSIMSGSRSDQRVARAMHRWRPCPPPSGEDDRLPRAA